MSRKIFVVPLNSIYELFKDKQFFPLELFINIETLIELMYNPKTYDTPSSEIWTHIENNRADQRWIKSNIPGFSIEQMCDEDDSGIYEFLSVVLEDFMDKSQQAITAYTPIDDIVHIAKTIKIKDKNLYILTET